MHFIIYSGFDRDADISVVKQIQKILDNKKATYSLASYRESGFVGMSYNKFSDVVGDADVVIVVGGRLWFVRGGWIFGIVARNAVF